MGAEDDDGGGAGERAAVPAGTAQRLLQRLLQRKRERERAAAAAEGAGDPSLYGSQGYWEARYRAADLRAAAAKEEWYVGYARLGALFRRHLDRSDRMLLLGCGMSTLTEDMANDGYADVVGVDYSHECIGRMREEFPESRVEYRVMDVLDLQYADGECGALVDKGTLDTLCQNEDGAGARMLREACRVLRDGGVFLSVSYGDKEDRLPLLLDGSLAWTLRDSCVLRKGRLEYFVYVMERDVRT